jgi:serine/threonine-protein kinase
VLNSFDPVDGSLRASGARCGVGAGSLTKDEPSTFAPPPAFGPFRVLHQIGVGALGPVFRTYEPTRDRLVAVKVFRLDITPEQAKTLADELAHAAEAGLFHPSIVEPIAAGVEGTVAYRAEEYVAAETLDVALRHYAPATVDKALPFITQLAGAIDFARAAGVGHGALHPRDVFVTPEETRATGFGVVDALERVGLRAPVRRPYSAPERIEGRPWGTPADVFSLGAIAYELLTGRRPSGTGAEIGTLAGANVGSHAEQVLAVLAMAMDPNPSRRHQTALAFAGSLEAASRGESSAVPIAPPASLPAQDAPVVAAPAVAAKATPVVPPPAPADDISIERDDDEALHELSLKEQQSEADAQHEGVEPEAEADRFVADAAAVASDDASERYRDDFHAAPVDRPVAQDVAPVGTWESDRGQRIFDPASEHRAGTVVPAQGSRVVPLAAMLSIGLLVGFAVGYGVGSRNPGTTADGTAASAPTQPAPAPVPTSRDYSEQSVAPRSAATPQPSATAPPVPADVPPAPSARRSVATTGRVVVESIPTRAGVMVNGRWRGRTPLAIEQLPFGQYNVRVVQPGYLTAQQDFRLSAGDPIETLSVRLQRQPAARTVSSPPPGSAPSGGFTGTIFVDSRPRGARIFIDNKAVGTTPLSLPEVPIGNHLVRLELPDHRTWSVSTRVTAGQTARVTGSLERIE